MRRARPTYGWGYINSCLLTRQCSEAGDTRIKHHSGGVAAQKSAANDRKQLSQNKLGKVQRGAAAEPCVPRAAAQMREMGEPLSGRSPRWPGFPCNWKQSHLQQWELYLSRTIAAKAVLGRAWDRYEYVWSGMDLAARCETAASPVSALPAGCTDWQVLCRLAKEILKLLGAWNDTVEPACPCGDSWLLYPLEAVARMGSLLLEPMGSGVGAVPAPLALSSRWVFRGAIHKEISQG